jgi:translation initiation factor 2A
VPVFDAIIHDIQWTHSGEQFIVISGTQPSISTLYSKNSEPIFEFGTRYRNTIRINPFSNIVLIGGFGNLAGEVDFWDLDSHN